MQNHSNEKYSAAITGDMTLSVLVLDQDGFKIIGIDMLSKATLFAGTNCSLLIKALNDLNLLAKNLTDNIDGSFSSYVEGTDISRRPWRLESSWERKTVSLYDGDNKQIATRKFPKSISEEHFNNIRQTISNAINKINQLKLNSLGPYL